MTNHATSAEYRNLARKPKDRAVHALGRLKPGDMNKLEARYAGHLELRKRAGEVAWWKFEAIKLQLAGRTFLTVDFFVMLADGELQAHDCKGGPIEDDASAKLKFADELFPFRFFVVRETKRGAWSIKDVADGL